MTERDYRSEHDDFYGEQAPFISYTEAKRDWRRAEIRFASLLMAGGVLGLVIIFLIGRFA